MLSRSAITEFLAQTSLFGPMDEAIRHTIAGEMRAIGFNAGQTIFGRGDPGTEMYLVVSGRVRISILSPEGRELSFAHASTGAVFGEIAMLDGGLRTADATAVDAVNVLCLSKPAFKRLLETHPRVAEAVIRFLCGRIRDADQQLEAIALYPIEGRLARFFLATAKAAAPDDTEGQIAVDISMSQSELALLVGASRPKVNAALALLEASGAIVRSGTRITCSMSELEAIAGTA
ncbi:Crp/Fnr family transcriptional regulator [Hyphomicrobium sp. D-2]|uniref:Crp/Fnr family transcriptional regulator n=1 Tax=Hyphomicrobium sp. D-2 TaxID=3041621 RepID=UPI0024579114|nr:Crp/Fnr family transcriptional regulator [Hyphomicrobium sp. D-2]MDH4981903.1 Crp/Fnr family transcriptional regulator [Hyphomicrobium sp. D-2]